MDEENVRNNEPQEIEVIAGDGSELNISKVRDHLNVEEPSTSTPDKNKIVIPPTKK